MHYKLIKNESIKNIGNGYVYEHNNTKAKIIHIKNNDNNKVFSITFKTLPTNDTGVFHILEHCVLSGSKKYQLKEPFNILDKSTINTYLNAITFSDKTLYPIASTNDEDFKKLMDVYLDGVFFPLIKEKEGIFLQEAWHYTGEKINGIVYNEMKGEYETLDVLIDYKTKQKLFSGEGYAYDSGGYPNDIANLTYEEFIKTYYKYYSPTNSIIYLYGDLDIDYYLDYIHNEYLSKFDEGKNLCILKSKDLEEPIFVEDIYYDLNCDSNCMQASFKLNFSMCEEKNLAFEILSSILTENLDAKLKKALIQNGICKEVESYIDDDMIEPIFTIIIEDTKSNNLRKFKEIIFDVVQNIEIDEKMIIANITGLEFFYLEQDFGYKPRGLFYNILLLKNMLYENYSFDILNFKETIENVKKLDLKKLLIENILNNQNAVYTILRPRASRKSIDYDKYTKNTQKLIEYQEKEDTEDNLDKLKPIQICDIKREIESLNTQILTVMNRPLIYNKINSDITYFNMMFDISNFSNYYKQYISIYIYLIGKLNTKRYKIDELDEKINLYLGGASTANTTIGLKDGFKPVIMFSSKFLNKNTEQAFDLINEIFENTILDDKINVKKYLLEYLEKIKYTIFKNPKKYSILRARACIDDMYLYNEHIDGITFYNWLKNLIGDIDKNLDNIISKMNFIKDNIFTVEKSYFGYASVNLKSSEFIQKFDFMNNKTQHILDINLKETSKNEGIILNLDVNYNTLVSKISKLPYKESGYLLVLNKIIETDYLWSKIRTEGGAYEGEMSIDRGDIILNSYRDPNIIKTYSNFKRIPEYLHNLNVSKSLHMYKVSTISSFDIPIKNTELNKIAIYRYFKEISDNDILKTRNEILDCEERYIKHCAEKLENAMVDYKVCTIGNRDDIYKSREEFNSIYTMNL